MIFALDFDINFKQKGLWFLSKKEILKEKSEPAHLGPKQSE